MSNQIILPYNYTHEEKVIIRMNFKSYNDWTKSVFDSIKSNIISHLRIQQDNRCCYCKYPLGFDIKQVDIEHIIPKSEYSKFTFEPFNLALSCPGCNTKKSTKSVLKTKIVNHPINSINYYIVHAHFDNYYHHIDILGDCVFIAKTDKGSETITFCELYRLSSAEMRAQVFKQKNPSAIKQLVEDLKNGDAGEKKELIEIISKLIK